jgi:hypothetical protein
VERRAGHLIEQGLEKVVIVLVDHHDIGFGLPTRAGCGDSTKATSHDDDSGSIRLHATSQSPE